MSEQIELTHGRWTLHGSILTWTPDDPTEWLRATERRPIDRLIACPACRANVTQPCRTKTGHTRTAHACRLAPRLCPCGSVLAAQRRLCDGCRDDSRRASKRDYLRRRRAVAA